MFYNCILLQYYTNNIYYAFFRNTLLAKLICDFENLFYCEFFDILGLDRLVDRLEKVTERLESLEALKRHCATVRESLPDATNTEIG